VSMRPEGYSPRREDAWRGRPPTPEPTDCNKAELSDDMTGEAELPTEPDHATALDKADRSDRADTVHGDQPCHCQHCNTAR